MRVVKQIKEIDEKKDESEYRDSMGFVFGSRFLRFGSRFSLVCSTARQGHVVAVT